MLTVHGRTEFRPAEISHIKETLASGEPVRIQFTFAGEAANAAEGTTAIPEGLVMLDFVVVMHQELVGEVMQPVYMAMNIASVGYFGGIQAEARKALKKHASPSFSVGSENMGASYILDNIIGGMQYQAYEYFVHRHG